MKAIGPFHQYLIHEFVEDYRDGLMSRRDMIRRVIYITGGVASAATVLSSMGITPSGIPFSNDGRLTDVFFLVCSTSDHEHLRILARLSRVINDVFFLSDLRAAPDAQAARDLIVARDLAIRDQRA